MMELVFRIPAVLAPGILPLAELSAARLDGELFAVDDSWVCADEPDRPEIRASALSALLPRSQAVSRLVMTGVTAAWLHGATDAPPWRHEVCSRLGERASLRLASRFVARELVLADGDVEMIGSLRVTTPARTVFDLARRSTATSRELAAVQSLVHSHAIHPIDMADGIRSTLPGGGLAVDRVAALWGQPPLTR